MKFSLVSIICAAACLPMVLAEDYYATTAKPTTTAAPTTVAPTHAPDTGYYTPPKGSIKVDQSVCDKPNYHLQGQWSSCCQINGQSPIDITKSLPEGCTGSQKWKRNWSKIVDAGKAAVSIETGKVTVSFDTPAGTASWNGKSYDLVSIEFHSISEHTFKGDHFPLEAQFVHKSADNKLLIVTQWFKGGLQASPAYTELFAQEDYDQDYEGDEAYASKYKKHYYDENKHYDPNVLATKELRKIFNFVAAKLLTLKQENHIYGSDYDVGVATSKAPTDFNLNVRNLVDVTAGLYSYSGTTTTPSCTEAVWLVLGTTLDTFSKIIDLTQFVHSINNPQHDKSIIYNNRNVQPLLKRPLYAYCGKKVTYLENAPKKYYNKKNDYEEYDEDNSYYGNEKEEYGYDVRK